jgi:hypothetical protein
MKLATHLHLVLWISMVELYLHSPMCIHGILLNYVIEYRDNFTSLCIYNSKSEIFSVLH